jgi:hypothetical protein
MTQQVILVSVLYTVRLSIGIVATLIQGILTGGCHNFLTYLRALIKHLSLRASKAANEGIHIACPKYDNNIFGRVDFDCPVELVSAL